MVGVGWGREVYVGVVGGGGGGGGGGVKKGEEGRGEEVGNDSVGRAGVAGSSLTPDTGSSDEEWEVEGEGGNGGMNGEAVREGMEKWRMRMVERGAVWGVGWLITVVGLWGDRFGEMS